MRYSVIIPSFNRASRLAEAIDSVLSQNYTDTEVIVIDDGSTDHTRQLLTSDYPQVRYLYQENQGPAAARNQGIQAATGEIVALLDSDDLWLPGKIDHELTLFQQFPQAEALAGNASSYTLEKLRCQDTFKQRGIEFPDQQARFFSWDIRIMEIGPVGCTSAMVFKKCALTAMGKTPFDASLRLNEDWDLEFRLFNNHQVLLYPQIYCQRRIFDDGTRLHYPVTPSQATLQQQKEISAQQEKIIGRYIDTLNWETDTQLRFKQRRRLLLESLEASDPM